MRRRGIISLSAQLRARMHLDQPGAQVEITERADGVFELRPTLPVSADQSWFWQQDWQDREREVEAHLARGEAKTHASTEDFLAYLDQHSGAQSE